MNVGNSRTILKQIEVDVKQGITVSDDYGRIRNKPKINGVVLERDHTATELSLLSNKENEYQEVTMGVDTKDSFLLVLGGNGVTNKIKLEEISRGRFQTKAQMDGDVLSGNYIFKKMEEK